MIMALAGNCLAEDMKCTVSLSSASTVINKDTKQIEIKINLDATKEMEC